MVDALLGFGVSDAVEVQLLCIFLGAGRFMRRVGFFSHITLVFFSFHLDASVYAGTQSIRVTLTEYAM